MPRADPRHVVVWSQGETLLAAALDDVIEVADVGPDGRADCRFGSMELASVAGIQPRSQTPRRAIVLRSGQGFVAVGADTVDGVLETDGPGVRGTPAWLRGVDSRHVKALVSVDADRTAALLDVEAIEAP